MKYIAAFFVAIVLSACTQEENSIAKNNIFGTYHQTSTGEIFTFDKNGKAESQTKISGKTEFTYTIDGSVITLSNGTALKLKLNIEPDGTLSAISPVTQQTIYYTKK